VSAGGAAVRAYLEEAIARGVTPGAVAWVAEGERVLHRSAHGAAQIVPEREPMCLDTPFDLASLTKPLATALLAVLLERDLGLSPDTPARRLLPELDSQDHAGITLRHLLSHCAGLPAWRPLFLHAEDAPGYLRRLRHEPLEGPPGERAVYSDPGYMAAGEMVSRAAGAPLETLFAEAIAGPLGLRLGFRPPPETARRAAATEVGQEHERRLAGPEAQGYRGFREGPIRGEVHDHHAWVAGGVLGSAGLFGTAADLHRLGLEILGEGGGLLPARARERLSRRWGPDAGEARSEGFALNLGGAGSGGPGLGDDAFGHSGFTGTSIWFEPRRRRVYVLLTNRIHPRVGEVDMFAFRRGFHAAAARLEP
jgi:CubicO group peptidase (beta-lactamase class C family)